MERFLVLICLSVLLFCSAAFAQRELKADATGMVPGDIVLGNIDNFPGHAGIYIGKWQDLPPSIQKTYSEAYRKMVMRNRDPGLATSYLVVDSDSGRGAEVRSFAEQFTNYLPKGQRTPNLLGATGWESHWGMAIGWPTLAVDDPRRWAIVEEALAAVIGGVTYPTSHMQWETTSIGQFFNNVPEPIQNPQYADRVAVYGPGRPLASLDCIALVITIYSRAAGIDIDVSVMPWHTPEQLYEAAYEQEMYRFIDFTPVVLDAAFAGKWQVTLSDQTTWGDGETEAYSQIYYLKGEVLRDDNDDYVLSLTEILEDGRIEVSCDADLSDITRAMADEASKHAGNLVDIVNGQAIDESVGAPEPTQDEYGENCEATVDQVEIAYSPDVDEPPAIGNFYMELPHPTGRSIDTISFSRAQHLFSTFEDKGEDYESQVTIEMEKILDFINLK